MCRAPSGSAVLWDAALCTVFFGILVCNTARTAAKCRQNLSFSTSKSPGVRYKWRHGMELLRWWKSLRGRRGQRPAPLQGLQGAQCLESQRSCWLWNFLEMFLTIFSLNFFANFIAAVDFECPMIFLKLPRLRGFVLYMRSWLQISCFIKWEFFSWEFKIEESITTSVGGKWSWGRLVKYQCRILGFSILRVWRLREQIVW